MAHLSIGEIKYVRSLHLKKYRKKHNKFIAQGDKVVRTLLDSHLSISKIYALDSWVKEHSKLINKLIDKVITIDQPLLKQISTQQSPNQVILIGDIPNLSIIDKKKQGLTLLLDTIQDPGNMGTIIRIAHWFGIQDIICSLQCVDIYSPKVIDASMGAIGHINIGYKNLHTVLQPICDQPVYAAVLDGENIFDYPLNDNAYILIGNESRGIDNTLLAYANHKITIPSTQHNASSLNAAVATGIICAAFRNL